MRARCCIRSSRLLRRGRFRRAFQRLRLCSCSSSQFRLEKLRATSPGGRFGSLSERGRFSAIRSSQTLERSSCGADSVLESCSDGFWSTPFRTSPPGSGSSTAFIARRCARCYRCLQHSGIDAADMMFRPASTLASEVVPAFRASSRASLAFRAPAAELCARVLHCKSSEPRFIFKQPVSRLTAAGWSLSSCRSMESC